MPKSEKSRASLALCKSSCIFFSFLLGHFKSWHSQIHHFSMASW